MSSQLIALNSETYFLANEAIAELQTLRIPHAVTSTKRTEAEQAALYAQGREKLNVVNAKRNAAGMRPIPLVENAYTVTNCDGVRTKSNHQSGDALDVVPLEGNRPVWPPAKDPRWKQIADVFKKYGFEWGGDWKEFQDLPHYQRRKA